MDLRAGERAELYVAPAMAWIASFGLCALADAMLGCGVLSIFVAGSYGGTIIIALVIYLMLPSWRGWLR